MIGKESVIVLCSNLISVQDNMGIKVQSLKFGPKKSYML